MIQKLRPDMDIGNTIRNLRLQKGLTQENVITKMQLLGCTTSRMTYSKMERNQYNIKVSELIALKIIFDIEFNCFFEELVKEFDGVTLE